MAILAGFLKTKKLTTYQGEEVVRVEVDTKGGFHLKPKNKGGISLVGGSPTIAVLTLGDNKEKQWILKNINHDDLKSIPVIYKIMKSMVYKNNENSNLDI